MKLKQIGSRLERSQHTHHCPACDTTWDCDNATCLHGNNYQCDDCFYEALEKMGKEDN